MDIPHSDPPIAHCAAFGLLLYLPNVLEELVCVDTFATFEACATFEHVVESVVMAILPIQPEVTDHCASASMTADLATFEEAKGIVCCFLPVNSIGVNGVYGT